MKPTGTGAAFREEQGCSARARCRGSCICCGRSLRKQRPPSPKELLPPRKLELSPDWTDAPMVVQMGDAQLCLVFYTGKPKLSKAELVTIESHGHIITSQQRPDLEQLLEQVVRGYEKNEAGISRASDLNLATLDRHTLASWCAFHSVRLQSLLWRVD